MALHAFAKKWLNHKGLVLLNGVDHFIPSHAILHQKTEELELKNPIPMFRVGNIIEKAQTITVLSYEDVKKKGYIVISMPARDKWFKKQRIIYRLEKTTEVPASAYIYTSIPPNTTVEYDSINRRLRITGRHAGKFGFSSWVKEKE